MSPYKLVIHALKFGDAVTNIQRALAARFGVPVPSPAWQSWPQLIG
jgi:hypothetical protein